MSLYQFEAGELFYFVQDNICIDIGKMQHFWYYFLMVFFWNLYAVKCNKHFTLERNW